MKRKIKMLVPPRGPNCKRCRCAMDRRDVEYVHWHENAVVAVIQDVPAWVCPICSGRTYDQSVESNLQRMANDYRRMGATFPIPSTLYSEKVA